jgi:hypothetical protein
MKSTGDASLKPIESKILGIFSVRYFAGHFRRNLEVCVALPNPAANQPAW